MNIECQSCQFVGTSRKIVLCTVPSKTIK